MNVPPLPAISEANVVAETGVVRAHDASGVWRFREFLPAGYSEIVTMAEGNTLSCGD